MKKLIPMVALLITGTMSTARTLCPDTMTIDKLPIHKTYLTIQTNKKFKDNPYIEHYAAGKEISTKKKFTDTLFIPELIYNWIRHPGRFVSLNYEDINIRPTEYLGPVHFMLVDKKVKLEPEQPFEGYRFDKPIEINVDMTKIRYIFQSKFIFKKLDSDNPVTLSLTPNRSILDPKQREYITLGSLKYNLGKDFTVTSYCD